MTPSRHHECVKRKCQEHGPSACISPLALWSTRPSVPSHENMSQHGMLDALECERARRLSD